MRSSINIARALVFLPLFAAALPAQNNRLAGRIDSRHTVRLRGNVNAIAQPQFDEGPADSFLKMGRITLLLKPSAPQQAALEQLLTEQQDPSSPNFRNWLTPEQYADRFGLSPADIAEIVSWLQSQGFIVEEVARGRNWIAFSGTAGLVERAFGTPIRRYRRDGELHFANATEPTIPAVLEPLAVGFLGLDDVHPKPAHVRRGIGRNFANPDFNFGSGHYLAPDDVAVIYGLNPLYGAGFNGTGQKIVVAGQSSVNLTDINAFRNQFHLSVNPPQTILVGPDPGQTGDMGEADLDLEWAGAVARGAAILYVYAVDVLSATQAAINQNLAPIIGYSFGTCEASTGLSTRQFFRSLAQQAAAQGITWVASSGDSGPADCDPIGDPNHPAATHGLSTSLPASVPEVTGVGGTRFNEGAGTYWSASNGSNWGSALSYIPETSWNDSSANAGLVASGGGASVAYAKPLWQSGPGVPADGARDVPDVSLSASPNHDGYIVCNAGSCATWPPTSTLWSYGGTSASAPVFAGMLALLQQYLIANHFQSAPGLGNINPTLYRLAQNAPSAFHDIQSGDNIVPCASGSPNCPSSGSFGFTAGPGYDQVTGLGSVDGNSLIANWSVDLCTYSLSPPAVTVLAGASTGSVTISTQGWCSWNALSGSSWLAITSATSGAGSGSVNYSVAANTASGPRTGALHIGGQTFTVTQNGTSPSPSLSITKTHSGSFAQGQQSAIYTVTVSNGANAGPTSGTVTVTEAVPSGLTLVSMSGTGWTCPGSACTRSDALGPAASYPAITVKVNVAANATSPQVNSVSVSGGGSATGSTTDSTNILSNITYTISGQVTLSGAGLSGVNVILGGSQSSSTSTDGSGNYTFSGVAGGGNYTVRPLRGGYRFSPSSQTFSTLSGNQTANFAAAVAVIGDFDGNGVPDLVWQNALGQVQVNYFGGAGGAASQGWCWLKPDAINDWRIVAVADFDGNGVPDPVWQNAAGQVLVNYYGGAGGCSYIGYAWLSPNAINDWRVVAAADFDGNGVPDLVWQNAAGQVMVYYYGGVNGSTYLGNAVLKPDPINDWRVVAAADFDGNGVPDLVWSRQSTGEVLLNYYGGAGGATYQGWNWLHQGGILDWRVVAVADFDRNGVPDLVWQNAAGQVILNYYGGAGGATYLGYAWLKPDAISGWRVVGPR